MKGNKNCFRLDKCTSMCINSTWRKWNMSSLQEIWGDWNSNSSCTGQRRYPHRNPALKIFYCSHPVNTCISRSAPPCNTQQKCGPNEAWQFSSPFNVVPARTNGLQKHKMALTYNSHTQERSCPTCMLTQAVRKKEKGNVERKVWETKGKKTLKALKDQKALAF